jgi:hypothetical protein
MKADASTTRKDSDYKKLISDMAAIEKLLKDIRESIELAVANANKLENEMLLKDARIQELRTLIAEKTKENTALTAKINTLERQPAEIKAEIKRFLNKLSSMSGVETSPETTSVPVQKPELVQKTTKTGSASHSAQEPVQTTKTEVNKGKPQMPVTDTIQVPEPKPVKIDYTPLSKKAFFDKEVNGGAAIKMITNPEFESQMDANYANAVMAKIKLNNSIYYYIDKSKIMGAVQVK